MELRDGKDASGRKPVVGLIRKKKNHFSLHMVLFLTGED